MESCSAELVIYVPKIGSPTLTRTLIDALGRLVEQSEGALALFSVIGGTITLRDPDAPYGNPYGIGPDKLPNGIDSDHHVAAHSEWEATIVWTRNGTRAERASGSNEREPL